MAQGEVVRVRRVYKAYTNFVHKSAISTQYFLRMGLCSRPAPACAPGDSGRRRNHLPLHFGPGVKLLMESFGAHYFQRRQAWRSGLTLRLRLLVQWAQKHGLLEPASAARIADMQRRLESDAVSVAFIGEMSRGKSELINAVFFGNIGARLLPVGPGRTTMCPIEIASDTRQPPSLRLLPIETRADPRALAAWHAEPQAWVQLDFPADDPEQRAAALDRTTWTVTDAAGSASGHVPRWRHATLNLSHPLLDRGMRIFDTPGLNALGAEPELTLDLLPQCDVIAFVLSADAGVTASDMAIWHDHLALGTAAGRELLVVINKADTQGDPLSPPHATETQLHRQRQDVARLLNIAPQRVLTVSARQGLEAKIRGDAALRDRSGLPLLEQALAEVLFVDRQRAWSQALGTDLARTQEEMHSLLEGRRQEIKREKSLLVHGEHPLPQALGGGLPIAQSQTPGRDGQAARIRAMQSIVYKLLQKIRRVLAMPSLDAAISQLGKDLHRTEEIAGVRQAYETVRRSVVSQWEPLQQRAEDMAQVFAAWSSEAVGPSGVPLRAPARPDMAHYAALMEKAVDAHLQFLGSNYVHKLKQAEFTDRLTNALHRRIRDICKLMEAEFSTWHQQMDSALTQALGSIPSQPTTQKTYRTPGELAGAEEAVDKLLHTLATYFLSLEEGNSDY